MKGFRFWQEDGIWWYETISGVCHQEFSTLQEAVDHAKERFGIK